MLLAPITDSPRVIETAIEPFRYFLAERCVEPALEQALLEWFEGDAPWKLVETDFYEQSELSLLDVALPPALCSLVAPDGLAGVRRLIERTLKCSLTEKVELVAHRLLPGQRIGIHNDYLEQGETHRFTVQINHGLNDDAGGFFMLFDGFDAAAISRVLRPVSNTGIGFAIGPTSHHAVSRVQAGARYTLVYSFHATPVSR